MTYRLIEILNDWTPRGACCNVRDGQEITGLTAVECGKLWAEKGIKFSARNHSVWFVINETNGDDTTMIELYAAVIGAETFAAQLADESFSINLDNFFKSLL